jgi:hypothetical protein
MSTLGRKRIVMTALVLGAALTLAVALGVGRAGAASGSVDYSLAGTYSYSQTCEGGSCTNVYSYTGTGSCRLGCTGFPSGADVTITLGGDASRTHPPNTCISKSVSGTYSITWSDATSSTGTLSGRSRDGKAFSLSGTLDAGPFAGGSISVLVGFPPNPCLSGSFTGGFTLYPPSLI